MWIEYAGLWSNYFTHSKVVIKSYNHLKSNIQLCFKTLRLAIQCNVNC